jgi:hypothetical protein
VRTAHAARQCAARGSLRAAGCDAPASSTATSSTDAERDCRPPRRQHPGGRGREPGRHDVPPQSGDARSAERHPKDSDTFRGEVGTILDGQNATAIRLQGLQRRAVGEQGHAHEPRDHSTTPRPRRTARSGAGTTTRTRRTGWVLDSLNVSKSGATRRSHRQPHDGQELRPPPQCHDQHRRQRDRRRRR